MRGCKGGKKRRLRVSLSLANARRERKAGREG